MPKPLRDLARSGHDYSSHGHGGAQGCTADGGAEPDGTASYQRTVVTQQQLKSCCQGGFAYLCDLKDRHAPALLLLVPLFSFFTPYVSPNFAGCVNVTSRRAALLPARASHALGPRTLPLVKKQKKDPVKHEPSCPKSHVRSPCSYKGLFRACLVPA